MPGPLDPGPMTGDQCALCGELLEASATVVELDDGKLLHVCGACAADRAGEDGEDEPERLSETDVETTMEHAQGLLAGMLERTEEGLDSLRRLTSLVDALDEELARSQMYALGLEERIRGLETDLDRTRELLRRAEGLLAATQDRDPEAADTRQHASPRFPEPAPDVVVDVDELVAEDVRRSQRVFNESVFTEKMRSVRRSLGRPIVNLARVTGPGRNALLTVAWDIVWYQFLLDLVAEDDEPSTSLFAEGMELSELSPTFTQSNAAIDDQGRLDASELELSLERDHPAHLVAETDERAEADDATEEIWNKASMPEFRWDD